MIPGMPTPGSAQRPADPPAGAPTSLAGRRTPDGPEVYAMSPDGVEQLQSSNRYGSSRLEWTDSHLSMIELSHVVLVRVAGLHPSLHVATLFAADVVMRLPKDDWVLDSRDVWLWIEAMSVPRDWSAVDDPRELAGRAGRCPCRRGSPRPGRPTGGRCCSREARSRCRRGAGSERSSR
jgi:hypothetical protein